MGLFLLFSKPIFISFILIDYDLNNSYKKNPNILGSFSNTRTKGFITSSKI